MDSLQCRELERLKAKALEKTSGNDILNAIGYNFKGQDNILQQVWDFGKLK